MKLKHCDGLSMFVVVLYWWIRRTTDLENLSSSTGECTVQFFDLLLCCNVNNCIMNTETEKII